MKVSCIFVLCMWCAIVAPETCSESCAITFVQGDPLPVQVRGETLPFWFLLNARVRQRDSYSSYSQGNDTGVQMVPRPKPLSVC